MASISAKHILVQKEFEAQDLLKKIDQGVTFEELAKDFSTCPSAQQGGDLGSFGKGMMVKEFEDAAFSLAVGEVTKVPVKTQFGHHLIYRTA